MEKRPLVIIKGKTIEVSLPDGFNLVVNGESFVAMDSAIATTLQDAASQYVMPDVLSAIPPSTTPEVIILPSAEPKENIQTTPVAGITSVAMTGTFFESFEKLRAQVPRIGLQCVNNENSPYCQLTEESKNCYMTFASYKAEDCYYNTRVFYCRDCMDCSFCHKCELCYECIDCISCYDGKYLISCEQAIECEYCLFCRGTQNCFGCVGLEKKSFCVFNEQYTRDEYMRKLTELKQLPKEEIIKRVGAISVSIPRISLRGANNEDTFGDNIFNSKNVYWGFDSKSLFDAQYVYHCDDSKDLTDCSHLGWSELCYEIMSGGKLTNCNFSFGCWNSNNLEYCELVYNSNDCFGCIGLNHAQYAILNAKYPKEEYFKRIAEIKDNMKKDGSYGRWFTSPYPEVLTAGLQ